MSKVTKPMGVTKHTSQMILLLYLIKRASVALRQGILSRGGETPCQDQRDQRSCGTPQPRGRRAHLRLPR
jgi:hypothetical protein